MCQIPQQRERDRALPLPQEKTMKARKINAVEVWKQIEDVLVPRLQLTTIERAIYSYLVRHSRLEGVPRLSFSIAWLAKGTGMTNDPARRAVRRLAADGVLRVVQRSKAGHVVEVRLPGEVRAARALPARPEAPAAPGGTPRAEEADFTRTKELREAIHAREGGNCFYCLRRMGPPVRCLDHVVPQAKHGRNSFRNLVSCCMECNSRKGEKAKQNNMLAS